MGFFLSLINTIIKRDSDIELDYDENRLYNQVYKDLFGTADVERNFDNDRKVFEYYYQLFKDNLNLDDKRNLDIWMGLIHFKNRVVSLEEFCNYCGFDGSRVDIRKIVLDGINGTFAEARVGNVDISNFNGSNFEDIKLDTDLEDNPLLFITSLSPISIKEFVISSDADVNFIAISDLHLDLECIDEYGNIDEEKFNVVLDNYVVFKNKLISEMRKKGIKIDGIVFVGDMFEAYANKSSLSLANGDFRDKFVQLIKDYNSSHDDSLKIRGDECSFVASLAGNHDMTLGKKRFLEVITEFGEEVKFLGAGSSRIKINDEYISFTHPNSVDWGLPNCTLFSYETRRKLAERIFCFDEYFQICKKYFDSLSFEDRNSKPLGELIKEVNLNIKNNNPDLYSFYKPFITEGDKGNSYFSKFITFSIENGTLAKTLRGPKVVSYKKFLEQNPNIERLIESNNPTFTSFQLKPTLTSVGHFHERLQNNKLKVGTSSAVNLPIYSLERTGKVLSDETTYVFSHYGFKIEKGIIKVISVQPYSYTLRKRDVNGLLQYSCGISTHDRCAYVKK